MVNVGSCERANVVPRVANAVKSLVYRTVKSCGLQLTKEALNLGPEQLKHQAGLMLEHLNKCRDGVFRQLMLVT
jgi:hypothetical protein